MRSVQHEVDVKANRDALNYIDNEVFPSELNKVWNSYEDLRMLDFLLCEAVEEETIQAKRKRRKPLSPYTPGG